MHHIIHEMYFNDYKFMVPVLICSVHISVRMSIAQVASYTHMLTMYSWQKFSITHKILIGTYICSPVAKVWPGYNGRTFESHFRCKASHAASSGKLSPPEGLYDRGGTRIPNDTMASMGSQPTSEHRRHS